TALAVGAGTVLQSGTAAEPPPTQVPGGGPIAKPGFKPDWLDDPLYRASEALVSWWPADGHELDLAGPHHGRQVGPVAFAGGCCGEGFSLPDGKGAVTVPRAAGLADTFTLLLWVNPTATREAGQPHPLTGTSGQRYAVFPTFGSVEAREAGCGI